MNKQKVEDELERLHQKYKGCKTDIEIGCMQIISFMNHEIKRGAFDNDDSLQQQNERLKNQLELYKATGNDLQREKSRVEKERDSCQQQNKAYEQTMKYILNFPYLESNDDIRAIKRSINNILQVSHIK